MTPWPSFETLQVFSQQKPFVTLRKAHYEHARKCVNEREGLVAALRKVYDVLKRDALPPIVYLRDGTVYQLDGPAMERALTDVLSYEERTCNKLPSQVKQEAA